MDLFDTIWLGRPPSMQQEEENHFLKIQSEFFKNLNSRFSSQQPVLELIQKVVNSGEGDFGIIQLFKSCFQWTDPTEKITQKFAKCAQLSSQLREKGNQEYSTGNKIKALRAYNLAIAFAPTGPGAGSEELALGYGNRSAIFVAINKPSLAIRDVDLAIENNIPTRLIQKLRQRREKCEETLKKLKNSSNSSELKQPAAASLMNNHLFTLKCANEKIISVENFVDISWEKERGRKLIVTQDVPAGTILCVEQPYVTVLEKELEWDLEHCHYCFKRILGGIPCPTCTFAMFCSQDCLSLATTSGSHRFDHFTFSYFHSQEILHHSDLMSLRIITSTNPATLHKRFVDFKSSSNCQNGAESTIPSKNHITGFNAHNIYESSFEQIYKLISHDMTNIMKSTSEELVDLLSDVLKAFILTKLLESLTPFFNTKNFLDDSSSQPSFKDFISSMIFHHFQNLKYNAISFSEIIQVPNNNSTKATSPSKFVSSSFAVGIFPTISLANHSCSPNTIHVRNWQHCSTSFISLKPLRMGQEITITYGPKWQIRPTIERQVELKSKYKFECKCEACELNWCPKSITTSIDEAIDLNEVKRNCSFCNDRSRSDDKNIRDGQKPSECKSCLGKVLNLNLQLNLQEEQLRDVYNKILNCETNFNNNSIGLPSPYEELNEVEDNYWNIIEQLKPCLDFYGTHFKPTFNLTEIGQDLFKKILVYYVLSTINN